MNSPDHFLLFSLIFLFVGFILGRLSVNHSNEQRVESFFKQQKKRDKTEKQTTIDIDTSKHVVKIDTNNLEKKYSSIGNKQTSNEDITSSINKLKGLKK